jgi:hypothetical protein
MPCRTKLTAAPYISEYKNTTTVEPKLAISAGKILIGT